eukprot:scaffold20524_cov37-Phaeocystis_antarctica.AAC.1
MQTTLLVSFANTHPCSRCRRFNTLDIIIMRTCRHAALPRARTAQYYKRRAGDLELEREAGLGGGGLPEAGHGGVTEVVRAQAAGGRRSSEWAYIRSEWCGRDDVVWWACCGFALTWHADVARWLVVR